MYSPTAVPTDPAAIPDYLSKELQALAQSLQSAQQFAFLQTLHKAPAKPRAGMVVKADGTDWDPGSGAGYYGYVGSAWVFFGGGGGGGGITGLTGDVLVAGPTSGIVASAFDLSLTHAWTANQRAVEIVITDASTTTAVDARTSNNFKLLCTSAVGATRAIPNPTNLSTGMILNFEIIQPATGGPCAVTWGAKFKWGVGGQGSAPSSSTAANAVDFYSGYVAADGNIYIVQLGQTGGVGPAGPAGSPGPAFSVSLATAQTFSFATTTKCSFDTVFYDTSSYWDATNKRFTPLLAGKYRFQSNMQLEAATVSDWGLVQVRMNGNNVRSPPIFHAETGLGQVRVYHAIDLDMNGSTDYVEAWGYVNSGSGTLTMRGTSAGTVYCHFSGSFLHT